MSVTKFVPETLRVPGVTMHLVHRRDTSSALPPVLHSSGNLSSFRLRACLRATPLVVSAFLHGVPSPWCADTNRDKSGDSTLHGITSPAKHPHLAACCSVMAKDVKRTATRTETAGEGQWQTEAAQQQHTLNDCESIRMTLSTGKLMKGTDGIGPLSDRTDACSDGDNSGRTISSLWWVLTLVEATFCQPWWGSFGSRSFNLLVPGLTLLQAPPNLGSWHPRSSNVLPNLPLIPNTWKTGWPPLHHSGVPGSDHLQTVCPTPPMCGVACPLRVRCPIPNLPMSRAWWRHRGCVGATSLKTCSSCLSAKSRVNSGTTVLKKKFPRVDA